MESKQAADTDYKRVLSWLLPPPERMTGMRLGVAGHNLFDIAFAHLLAEQRGVTERIELEMLRAWPPHERGRGHGRGQLLFYVPAVKPAELDVAMSYLVRRLEENSATSPCPGSSTWAGTTGCSSARRAASGPPSRTWSSPGALAAPRAGPQRNRRGRPPPSRSTSRSATSRTREPASTTTSTQAETLAEKIGRQRVVRLRWPCPSC
ncbi:proline dehydrogenase family protein [Kocuria rhizophila]|nr:proline dehydrogenase family protein [Kocuria rhizophila]